MYRSGLLPFNFISPRFSLIARKIDEEEDEPGFFYPFSCLCVAFVWLAQLCNEKVYERAAFTPDKWSVAESERGLSLL